MLTYVEQNNATAMGTAQQCWEETMSMGLQLGKTREIFEAMYALLL